MLVTEVPAELDEDVVSDTAGVGAAVGAAVGLAVGAMVGAGLGASEGASVVGVPGVRVLGEAVTGAEVVMEPFLLPFLLPLSFLPPFPDLVVTVAVGAAVTMTGEVLSVVDATGASVGALVVEALSDFSALLDLRARRVSALEPDERARAATARTKSLFCIIIVL